MDRPELTVCAVVCDAGAIAGQRRAPDFVELVRGDGLHSAVARAGATGATWIWLLDGAVTPAATALQELLAPLEHARALEDPILLSSMVVDAAGEFDVVAAPWPRLFWKENAILGAEHGLAALRAARYGSLLVHRRALDLHGAPRADFAAAGDDLEWTGRLLRETPGYLVPGSVCVRKQDARPESAAFARNRVRMLRGEGWAGQEKLWFAFLLTRDMVREVSARPARTPRLLRAVGAGVRARP